MGAVENGRLLVGVGDTAQGLRVVGAIPEEILVVNSQICLISAEEEPAPILVVTGEMLAVSGYVRFD